MNGQQELFPVSAEAYQAFEEKFKPKLTTDDCYTPELVYDAVKAWVIEQYQIDAARILRPFWPGGDFMAIDYRADAVVVDNPPFSLLSVIIRWYCARGIRFFLFGPALTIFTAPEQPVCYLPTGVSITYENGAEVPTSFVTNLDAARVRAAPTLYKAVDTANKEALRKRSAARGKAELPKYSYPDQVITAAICQRWAKYGVAFQAMPDECIYISKLDAQRACGKAIFGGGFLLTERAAAERAAATKWALSDREFGLLGMGAGRDEQSSLF